MVPESVRIRFSKKGRLRYISHLDLCRTMVTAMTRAKIPMWYTEGFNPHPKLVFTQPLPLFAESECEYLDIKIVEPMSHEEICRRMRDAFTSELYTEEVYTPTVKFSDIAYACYRIELKNCDESKLAGDGELMAEKKAKDGKVKVWDIRPMVKEAKIVDGVLYATLNASVDSYLNPEVFCKAIGAEDYFITRTGWLKADGTKFV